MGKVVPGKVRPPLQNTLELWNNKPTRTKNHCWNSTTSKLEPKKNEKNEKNYYTVEPTVFILTNLVLVGGGG